ncbi:MAG: hypothetical protein J0I06_05955 [Planctomycetes bacterium]|nr:hypothetical protein [Planctomycetota bacterium]
MLVFVRRACALVVLSALVAGCSDRPKLAKVKGTVTLDGKPLPFGTVTFEAKGLLPATGKIVNGEITEVTTYDPGDGAPVGGHRIAVTANAEPGPAVVANPGETAKAPKGDYMSGKSLIPSAYNNPDTSGLSAEVKSGENTVEIKLLSSGPPK